MKRNWTKILSILAIVLSLSTVGVQIFIMATSEQESEAQYKGLIKQHYQIFAPPIPDKVSFCGEKIPIDNVFVREALDRELTLIMYQQSTTFLILKRAERFFPEIEKVLKEQGVPDDIKYLAVAESSLANAVSGAKAEGVWQFVEPTAKEYGMEVSAEWDDRYDLRISTIAACKYLKQKQAKFNDWALACASYNAGEAGVRGRMRDQKCDNYWKLYTNNETSRYVYRIIAYKLIMENPQQYGYYFRMKDTYQPIPTKEIKVDTTINDLFAFAQKINVPYLYLKRLNPALRDSKLINKTGKIYRLKIPNEEGLSYGELTESFRNERLVIQNDI